MEFPGSENNVFFWESWNLLILDKHGDAMTRHELFVGF